MRPLPIKNIEQRQRDRYKILIKKERKRERKKEKRKDEVREN